MIHGNQAKFLSYRFAFHRMQMAIQAEYYLEAVMIAESVISDRLHSATRVAKEVGESEKQTRLPSLGVLLARAGRAGMDAELVAEFDTWRKNRNLVAHELARSWPGTATMEVSRYLELARHTAESGIRLAKRAKDWQRSTGAGKQRKRSAK
jgi:hypothetical protein